MKYMILDLETQTHNQFKRPGNPFLPENYIVMRGWKVQGDSRCSAEYFESAEEVKPLRIPDDVDVIVAFNAKYELLYEMRFSSDVLHAFFKRGGRVWCGQYAEYLLNAQQKKFHMNSLDQVAPTYGGRVKIDGIKALWEAGVQTSDIDRDMLLDYLIGTEEEERNSGDIGNTELIYLGQIEAAEELGMLTAIKLRMEGLCATSEMEFRGLKIDVDRAKADLKKRTAELKTAEKELEQYITGLPEGLTFNWNSPTHKSALIFGGTIKYERQDTYVDPKTGQLARKKAVENWPLFDGEPVNPDPYAKKCQWDDDRQLYWRLSGDQDTFKSGKRVGEGKFKKVPVPGELKVKYQDFFHEMEGYTDPEPEWESDSMTDGVGKPIYSTAGAIIDQITNRDIPFLTALGIVNKLTKEIGTYYVKVDPKTGDKKGMLTCVQPWDHTVHHKLNHTSTVTSRLSSSDPNLQNLTRADFDDETGRFKSEVKAMFISRFGDEGEMVEIDYSQLEVVVMGLLSRDENLCRDLNNNVDFHCKRVAMKNSVSYEFALIACKKKHHPEHAKWKKERTKCKIFSFQRAYGAGAKLVADETGMAVEEVEALIKVEEKEYPGVNKFNEEVEREVTETSEPFHDGERGYRVFRRGTYQAITGTTYSFRSYDAPSYLRRRGISDTFSPTEMKNYPVQGTGGELVQMVLGQLWRWFVKNDHFGGKAFLVNTVHDCVWADCHKSVRDKVVAGMVKIMQAIPHFLKHFFGIDCPVSFPVDAETGPNMLTLQHWDTGYNNF
jgi:DNA polymerase I